MRDFSNTLPELELANSLYARVGGDSYIDGQGNIPESGLFMHSETAFIFRDTPSVSTPRIAGFMKERPLEDGEYYALVRLDGSSAVTCCIATKLESVGIDH